jgi:outer membrane protein OmpA-like peptidoglycan-associated protein
MRRLVGLLAVIGVGVVAVGTAVAQGPFVGVNLGASEPLNGNYRAHVRTGVSLSPYGGYMFNEYVGAQAELQAVVQTQDNHQGEDDFISQSRQTTSMLGGGIGPRLSLPIGPLVPYIVGTGGYYVGLSGRLSHSAPGFSAGLGVDYQITDEWKFGLYGRYNRAYMSPRPTDLGPGQVPDERYGEDIEWATAGLALTYTFAEAEEVVETPLPPPVPKKAEAIPLPPPTRKKIVLRSVYFEFDKATIRGDAAPVLDEAAGLLRDEGEINVAAEGHTDEIGTEEYNKRLSQRRADAVRGYLVGKGINGKRIATEAFGESRPVASNDTAEGRAQNRRVELRVEEIGK